MNQFRQLKNYHEQKSPLYLTNCWDVGSAKLIEDKDACVIGTSSYAVAKTLGYNDGERVPFSYIIWLAERLVTGTTLPVTIDAEGLYSDDLQALDKHAERLIKTGISGLNFEDQLLRGETLSRWTIAQQVERIQLIKEVAKRLKVDIFLNARTDVFFQSEDHQVSIDEVIERGRAYAQAGADCFFIPGVTDSAIIKKIVKEVPLPINIMLDRKTSGQLKWRESGVKRISTGPTTYLEQQALLGQNLEEVKWID